MNFSSQLFKAKRRMAANAVLSMMMVIASPYAKAGLAEEAAAASVDLYDRMTAKDVVGFLKYRPKEGFTEFTPRSKELQQLEEKPFVDLLTSQRKINLRAEDLKVQLLGNTAVVMGTRVGYISATEAPAPEVRYGLTMIWLKQDSQWQLLHLHYSLLASK